MTRAYTVSALADRWQCSEQHVYNLIKSGALTTFQIGTRRGTRISEDEITRWESGKKKATATAASHSENQPDGGLPTGAMAALASVRG